MVAGVNPHLEARLTDDCGMIPKALGYCELIKNADDADAKALHFNLGAAAAVRAINQLQPGNNDA